MCQHQGFTPELAPRAGTDETSGVHRSFLSVVGGFRADDALDTALVAAILSSRREILRPII